MLNFPNTDAEQLRKMRTHLFAAQSDPVWRGTVSMLLQMLIDNDLGLHRQAVVDNVNTIVQEASKHQDLLSYPQE
jgi:hypothetical protein